MSHRVPIGRGSPEGTNSAYLFPDRGLLVDPGPPGEDAWADLTDGLARADTALASVDHVVVTHWHIDHAGLAPRLAARAGATVHMHEADAAFVRTYERTHAARRERDLRTLERWGVPADRRETVREGDTPSPLPAETPVVGHTEGDSVAGATVWHTPGHTRGHLALAAGAEVCPGDTVLPTYTPNVGGSDTRADNPLPAYADSLARLEATDRALRPGHGGAIDPDRFDLIRDHHRERSRRVLEAVDALPEATSWTVARRLFGTMEGVHVKFGAGEAAAHLAWLADAGAVRPIDGGPAFAAVSTRWPAQDFPL